jgi:Arc/MetJ family transcription regulator
VYDKKYFSMRTNIDIDDKLLREALKHSKLNTKKEVVNMALHEFVKHHKRKLLLTLKGKVKWEGDLDKMRTYDKWDNS